MTQSLNILGIITVGVMAIAASAQQPQAVLNQYCVVCHNTKLQTGGLALDKLDLARAGANAETWEKVARKLRAGMMPPAGAPGRIVTRWTHWQAQWKTRWITPLPRIPTPAARRCIA